MQCVLKDNLGAELGILAHSTRELWSLPTRDRLDRHSLDSRCRGVLLNTSAVPATAWHAIRKDCDVAALAGHARHAVPDLAIKHDACTNARAKREHAH